MPIIETEPTRLKITYKQGYALQLVDIYAKHQKEGKQLRLDSLTNFTEDLKRLVDLGFAKVTGSVHDRGKAPYTTYALTTLGTRVMDEIERACFLRGVTVWDASNGKLYEAIQADKKPDLTTVEGAQAKTLEDLVSTVEEVKALPAPTPTDDAGNEVISKGTTLKDIADMTLDETIEAVKDGTVICG